MKFSKASLARLLTCHIDLQILFNRVIQHYDCTVVTGHRTEAEQNKAYAEKKSQLRYPKSKHNSLPSMAADVVPFEVNKLDWGAKQVAFFAGYVMATAQELLSRGEISHSIRGGIDWDSDNDVDDTKFWDACHFEIVEKCPPKKTKP